MNVQVCSITSRDGEKQHLPSNLFFQPIELDVLFVLVTPAISGGYWYSEGTYKYAEEVKDTPYITFYGNYLPNLTNSILLALTHIQGRSIYIHIYIYTLYYIYHVIIKHLNSMYDRAPPYMYI